jgi:phage protein D
MKLEALDRSYEDFYVPTLVVAVGGEDLLRDHLLAVTSVEVDLRLKSPGRFSVSIGNAYDWEARDFVAGERGSRIDLLDMFAFGAKVKVSLGYGEPSALSPMIEGLITEVGTSFTEDGNATLTLAGYDALYPLRLGRQSRHWDDAKLSDAITAVAGANRLSSDVQVKGATLASIDQTQESDLAFIERMAELSGSTFYMRSGKFYFGPRHEDRSPELEIPWGQGLTHFSPTANLANQVAGVEVHGWSAADAAAVVGRAAPGDEKGRDSGRKSGGEWAASAFGAKPKIEFAAPVRDQAEADSRAQAILDAHAQQFVTGEGECVGVPTLLPDTNLAFSGLGRAFSKTYYVSGATHQFDERGYRTRFAVQDPTL